MAGGDPLLRHIRRLIGLPEDGSESDGQLLECFVTQRDEAAFEMLLRRHGSMVLGTCRRILRNPHDAEDAFQAAFLVLCRKARGISSGASVGGWLHQVACRVALRVKADAARRPILDDANIDRPASEMTSDLLWRDLRPVLDEELSRLPERYRTPLVLHYLEGKTVAQAAHILGCPEGTVRSRLDRARERLRSRLTRRGLTLSAGAFAATLAQQSAAGPLPALLVKSTAKMAILTVLGQAALPGAVAPKAALLAKEVLNAMLLTKIKLATVVFLTVSAFGVGSGVVMNGVHATRYATAEEGELAQTSANVEPPANAADRPPPAAAEADPADKPEPEKPAAPAAEPAPPKEPLPRPAVVTIDQFRQSVQRATLALDRKLPALGLKTIRDSLQNGPPVTTDLEVMDLRRRMAPGMQPAAVSGERMVEASLYDLAEQWEARRIPSADQYATLLAIVLPEARPTEVFLYARPLGDGVFSEPRSVGNLLVSAARTAGRLDELRTKLLARRQNPPAELPANILLARIDLADPKNRASIETDLAWLSDRLEKDSSQPTTELICQAILPSLSRAKLAKSVVPILDKAVQNFASAQAFELTTSLSILLARQQFQLGQPAAGKQRLKESLALLNQGRDDQAVEQRLRVAHEYLRVDALAETLDLLGQVALPASGPQPTFGVQVGMVNTLFAGFARRLSAKPAAERYVLLKAWSLPGAEHSEVRLIGANLPNEAPSTEFGKFALPVDAIGGTPHLLIEAARAAGKLDELAQELRTLVEQNTGNARVLYWIVEIARGKGAALEAELKAQNPVSGWPDFLLAQACLTDPKLAELGESMVEAMIDQAKGFPRWSLVPNYRFALTASRARRLSGSTKPYSREPGLALWDASRMGRGGVNETGRAPEWWVVQDGHLSLLTGTSSGFLQLAYPLEGRFEFSVDAYVSPFLQGHLGYAGLLFEPNVSSQGPSLFTFHLHDRIFRQSDALRSGEYNRFKLQVEPGKVRCLVNDALYYEDDDASATFPWLTLWCRREEHATFRNPELRGDPKIPREVRLCQSDRLEGWSAIYYFETMPPRRVKEVTPAGAGSALRDPSKRFDWSAKNGEIHGRRLDATATAEISTSTQWYQSFLPYIRQLTPEPSPSWLQYSRPMRAKEKLRYEFFYQPGEVMVHPSLGKLVFLLEPEGVRLHWLTTGGDKDWTGLAPDNAVTIAAERRGPAQLPLARNTWNKLQIVMTDHKAILELNDVPIYERALNAGDDRGFGFFHYKNQTEAKIRNAVFSGDWPEKLTPPELANSFTPREISKDTDLRRKLIGEELLR